MQRIAWLFLVLLFLISSPAMAQEQPVASLEPKTTVIMFVDSDIRQNDPSMQTILAGIKDKFKPTEIIVNDDQKRKSNEYMEFIENVKSDPVNESSIRVISLDHIAKYANAVNSKYIAIVYLTTWKTLELGINMNLVVVDAENGKYLINDAWNEGVHDFLPNAASNLMKRFNKDVSTSFMEGTSSNENSASNPNEKIKVVAFVGNSILQQPKLVEKIKTTVGARFNVKNVAVYIDEKPKSLETLELFAKIQADSAKQKSLVIKKEHLIKYGEDTGSVYVAAVTIDTSDIIYLISQYGITCQMKLKESVVLVDVPAGRYAQNAVYETNYYYEEDSAVDELLKKLQTQFKMR